MACCLICFVVVGMVVPAFAFSLPPDLPANLPYPLNFVSITSEMPDIPEQYADALFVIFDQVSDSGDRRKVVVACSEETVFTVSGNGSFSINNILRYWTGRITSDGVINWGSYSANSMNPGNIVVYGFERSDIPIYTSDGQVFYEGPKDLSQEVTGVLPTVLSWIQQTINALFVEGGALSGLLLLVAVPVAITLLLFAARFIRSMIWGA